MTVNHPRIPVIIPCNSNDVDSISYWPPITKALHLPKNTEQVCMSTWLSCTTNSV
jgi:hypothetical protein